MARASVRKIGAARFEEDFLDAVGLIYEAGLEPDLWPAALSQVARVCNAKWTPLVVWPLDFAAPPIKFEGREVVDELEQLAPETRRFLTPDHNAIIRVHLAAPPGRINLREESFTDREWERTEIYNEMFRPLDVDLP